MVKSKRVNPLRKKSKSITSKNHKIMYGGVKTDEKGLAVDIRDILNMLRDRGDSIIIKPELTFPPNNVTSVSLINQIIHNDDSRSDHGHKNELGDKFVSSERARRIMDEVLKGLYNLPIDQFSNGKESKQHIRNCFNKLHNLDNNVIKETELNEQLRKALETIENKNFELGNITQENTELKDELQNVKEGNVKELTDKLSDRNKKLSEYQIELKKVKNNLDVCNNDKRGLQDKLNAFMDKSSKVSPSTSDTISTPIVKPIANKPAPVKSAPTPPSPTPPTPPTDIAINNNVTDVESLTNCDNCGLKFTIGEKSEHAPITLNCLHYFCLKCVKELLTTENIVTCPVCKTETNINNVKYNSMLANVLSLSRDANASTVVEPTTASTVVEPTTASTIIEPLTIIEPTTATIIEKFLTDNERGPNSEIVKCLRDFINGEFDISESTKTHLLELAITESTLNGTLNFDLFVKKVYEKLCFSTKYFNNLCDSKGIYDKKADTFVSSGTKIKSIFENLVSVTTIFKDKSNKYQKERADYFSQGYRSLEDNIKSCLTIKKGYMCDDKGAEYCKYFWNLISVILLLTTTIETTYGEKIPQYFKRVTDGINSDLARKNPERSVAFKLSSCVWIDDVRQYTADYEKFDVRFQKMILQLQNNDSYFSSNLDTDNDLVAKIKIINDLIRELQDYTVEFMFSFFKSEKKINSFLDENKKIRAYVEGLPLPNSEEQQTYVVSIRTLFNLCNRITNFSLVPQVNELKLAKKRGDTNVGSLPTSVPSTAYITGDDSSSITAAVAKILTDNNTGSNIERVKCLRDFINGEFDLLESKKAHLLKIAITESTLNGVLNFDIFFKKVFVRLCFHTADIDKITKDYNKFEYTKILEECLNQTESKINALFPILKEILEIDKDKSKKKIKNIKYNTLESLIDTFNQIKSKYMCTESGNKYYQYLFHLKYTIYEESDKIFADFKNEMTIPSCVWFDDIESYRGDCEKFNSKFREMIKTLNTPSLYSSDDVLRDVNLPKKLDIIFDSIETLTDYTFEFTFSCIFDETKTKLFRMVTTKFFDSRKLNDAIKIKNDLDSEINLLQEKLDSMHVDLELQENEEELIDEIEKTGALLGKTNADYDIIKGYVEGLSVLGQMINIVSQFFNTVAICKICGKILYDRSLNPVKIIQCNHRFHKKCLTENWCINKDENTLENCKCAICKTVFNCNTDILDIETYFNDLKRQEQENEEEKAGGKRSNSCKRSLSKKRSNRKTRKLRRNNKVRKTKRNGKK